MRRFLFFVGGLLLMLLAGCSVPSDYAESVSFEIKRVDDALKEVEKAMDAGEFGKESAACKNALEVVARAKSKFETLGDFRGDDSLRIAALDYVNYCDAYFKNSLETVEELYKADNLTREENIELDALTKAFFYEAILPYRTKVNEEYVKFMRKYELIGLDR